MQRFATTAKSRSFCGFIKFPKLKQYPIGQNLYALSKSAIIFASLTANAS